MFKVERDDTKWLVKVFRDDKLVRNVNLSHRVDGQDLCNLLNDVYSWGHDDGIQELYTTMSVPSPVEVKSETEPTSLKDEVVKEIKVDPK